MNKFDHIHTKCSKCGSESHGAKPGQKHRKCPGRQWVEKPRYVTVHQKPDHLGGTVDIMKPGIKSKGGVWELVQDE